MTALLKSEGTVSVEEYLAGETFSDVKHEFLGGYVYAMAGAGDSHNVIAMNLYGSLHAKLRGKTCQPFGSDMKLNLRQASDTYIYYPDAMVVFDPTDSGNGWRERPSLVFEIISDSTRHVDEREKRMAYSNLPSLEAYVRIEPERASVAVDWRTDSGWKAEIIEGRDSQIKFPRTGIALTLGDLYERLEF
jgi:Uma2 family endonuclease